MNVDHEPSGNAPARVSLDRPIGRDFHYWAGASGKAYLHTVFGIGECPAIDNAVFVAVSRERDGRRRAVAAGIFDPFRSGRDIAAASQLGASEIHLHLLAETPAARRAALDDIRLRHLSGTVPRMTATAA